MKIKKINFKIKINFKKKKDLKKINRKIIKIIKTILINWFVNFKMKNNKIKFQYVEYFLKIKRIILIFQTYLFNFLILIFNENYIKKLIIS